jgi:hypothetical protein
MMGRFSGLSNMRTFARFPHDIVFFISFPGSLQKQTRTVRSRVLALSVDASVLVIACAGISSVD